MAKEEVKWKILEKVIAVLEGHLDHSASVERDVKLPVLSSSRGRRRQCDVVIRVGSSPRVTTTIVEVQKRTSKPTIAEFDGWSTKMQDVGAQHLICVSEVGFPSSVIEKAELIGPSVRLMTLQALEAEGPPLPVLSDELRVVRYDQLTGLRMEGQHLFKVDPNPDPNAKPEPHAKLFRIPGGPEVSATDLVDRHLFGNSENLSRLPDGERLTLGIKFEFALGDELQHKDFGGHWVPLKSLQIAIALSLRTERVEVQALRYEQLQWGEMGWVLRGIANLADSQFDVLVPVKSLGGGAYAYGRAAVIGDCDAFVSIGEKGYKAIRFDR